MADQFPLSFKLLIILYGILQGVSGIDDFTCVTKPRFKTSDQVIIRGTLVGLNGTLTFERTTYTGTSGKSLPLTLPANNTQGTQVFAGYALSTLDMPASGGKERIGVFACNAGINGNTLSIETVIMGSEAYLLPSFVSKTVNLGDYVSLSVRSLNQSLNETRWRKDGGEAMTYLNGLMLMNITNASVNDSGIYECHYKHHRKGRQAIFKLIVRGCPRDKWNVPDCDEGCPICLNGGVCDDVSGVCICPPGFSGETCQKLLGPNQFGQDGSLRCDSVLPNDSTTCIGLLFCLPDPYGCSCAAGYQGLYCTTVCENGTYGADCAQTCHCANGALCNGTTGQCDGGDCAPGYTGENCQVCAVRSFGVNCSQTCEREYTGENCTDKCLNYRNVSSCNTTCTATLDKGSSEPPHRSYNNYNSAVNSTISWQPVACPTNGVNIVNYIMKITRKESSTTEILHVEGISADITLSPCTEYGISVAAQTTKGIGHYSYELIFTTWKKAPDTVNNLTANPIDHDKLEVLWTAPGNDSDNPCLTTSILVTYDLLNIEQCQTVNELIGSLNTNNTTLTIGGLRAFSTYRVNVTTQNEAGNGDVVSLVVTTGETQTAAPVYIINADVNSSHSSLTFAWDPAPCGSRGGNTTHYQYDFQRSDDTKPNKSRTYSTFITFEGLSPCTCYSFRVRAFNSNNSKSPWTNVTHQNTSEIAPGIVTMLRAVHLSATKINITWQRPNATNCSVDQYTIDTELVNRDQCDGASPSTDPSQIESAMSPTTSPTLHPHSTYRFHVKAENYIGLNETSIEVTTSGSEPSGSPNSLTATAVTNKTISFSWDELKCGQRNGNITAYRLSLVDTTNGNRTTRNISNTSEEFSDLVPFTSYNFSVSAVNQNGSGPIASLTNRTLEGIPPAPSNVTFPSTSNDRVILTWLPPTRPHGNIISYDIRHWKTESESQTPRPTVEVNLTRHEIDSLDGQISYSFQVRAKTQIGLGPWSDVAKAMTKPGKPSKPDTLTARHIDETSITLHWNEPQYPNGRIHNYIVEHRVIARPYDITFKFDHYSAFGVQEVVDPFSLQAVIADLEPSTQYEVRVWVVNDAGIEGHKERLEVYTKMATDFTAPEKPTLIGKESTVSSIAIGLFSKSTSKYISHYQIGVRNIDNDRTSTDRISKRSVPEFQHHAENPSAYVAAELSGRLPGKFVVGDNKTLGNYWNPPLQEGAVYEIYVGAVSRINETMANVLWNSDPLVVEVDGDYSEPDSAGLVVGTILVILLLIVVILMVLLFMKKRQTAKTKNREADMSTDSTSSIQVELQILPSTSRVKSENNLSVKSSTGSNDETYTELNAPSDKSTTPSTTVMAQTTYVLSDDTSKPGPSVKPKHNQKSKLKSKSAKAISVSCTEPVAMTELARFIKARKSGKINGFQQDFETLPAQPTHPHAVAQIHENKKKNRYNNIPAYDHSRVLLETIEGHPHSDYINASYINGYNQDAKYIACQGPNQTTVNDMWRMVWQEQVGTIVILTNIVEKGKEKCEKYWPDEGSCEYGEIFVRKVNEEKTLNFIVRTFNLSKNSEPEGEYREVLQFHYITWPDMKPPESSSLLQFVRRIQSSETTQRGPTIVHCSAGVGRTGTYIALDAMLEQALAEGQVDVLNFVREMRDKRYLMVQTMDQLKFIYEALLESSLSENTAISVDRFHQDLTKLKKRDKKKATSGLEDQFKMLDTFTASMSDDECYGGKQPDNADKNRFADRIPRDSTRPYLMTDGGEGSTNYINATFLEGFKGKHSYLATQAPLPNTIGDIWRMVFDYKSSCIVMLNSMDNDPNTPQYWPEEGSMSFGPLSVKLLSVDQSNEDMVVRQFGIQNTDRNKEKMQTVCHIQLLQWPTEKDIPNSPSSLLKVLEAVKMWTQEHSDGPITVQCIDGEGCSGTFCALVTLLDRLEQDGIIDVFQAVKKLRSTQAGMVKTMAQYQLCYQVMTRYLDSASSSSVYENLRR